MTRYIDEYLSDCVPGYPVRVVPRFNSRISQVDSGDEQVNPRWEHPLRTFILPVGAREHDVYEALQAHFLVMGGPVHTWPFRNPLDFASVPLQSPNTVPALSGLDQLCGTGDGLTQVFQLQKTYPIGNGNFFYTRLIYHPILSTVLVSVNGVTQSFETGYSVSRLTGEITFDNPPSPGHLVKSGFLFDDEVRFESDDAFDGLLQTFGISGFGDLTFVEVRPCGEDE
jgi:uncharacterized protein (TIGR02217 family)